MRVIIAARWPIYHGRTELYPSLARESQNLATDSGPLMRGTPALLSRLGDAGVGVDLLGINPELDRPAPECVTRWWRTYSCDVTRSAEEAYWGDTVDWFDRLHAVLGDRSRIIDPIKSICDQDVCKAQSGGVINFFDTDHLSAGAAERLSDQISPTVEAVLSKR
ncbi:SGNH hydrolase domain-containing protein [Mycolicibacterium sp. CBMA 361]|uniref:SGNH hydrolase domain-containing protein n=1 Tax=Mycolicibacterium sp. CBMA 361 TaxID=2606610 RepID=UPI0012DDD9CD|nr:hypothetical protein [Mycolicibacterium sp. CBMA 361]